MPMSWAGVRLAGASVPPLAASRVAQVTASPATGRKQTPPVVHAGSVDSGAREEPAKSTHKAPGPAGSEASFSSAETPADEPSGRATGLQPALVTILPPVLPVTGSAGSQLYRSVAAPGFALL